MKYCLLSDLRPSDQTLQIIRQFSRQYKPTVNPLQLLKCIPLGIA